MIPGEGSSTIGECGFTFCQRILCHSDLWSILTVCAWWSVETSPERVHRGMEPSAGQTSLYINGVFFFSKLLHNSS